MLIIRRADQRGRTRANWLDSRHSFSFAGYLAPRHMGVSSLRVLNEDRVDPGEGFPPHAHRDVEIVSIVLEGTMAHRDSTGGGSVLHPGEVQLMHAGTGITHSEYNASDSKPLHFLQIWIQPARRGGKPGHVQGRFLEDTEQSVLRRILDPDGTDDALPIRQDVRGWQARLQEGEALDLPLAQERQGWLQVVRGDLVLDGEVLTAGDGAHLRETACPSVRPLTNAEFIFLDLA